MANNNNSNQLLAPGAQQAIDQMKFEIAQEFGVNLGADTTSRANGSVGGEITKRLVQMAEQQLGGGFLSTIIVFTFQLNIMARRGWDKTHL